MALAPAPPAEPPPLLVLLLVLFPLPPCTLPELLPLPMAILAASRLLAAAATEAFWAALLARDSPPPLGLLLFTVEAFE